MNKSIFVLWLCILSFSASLHAFNLRKTGNSTISGRIVNSVWQDKHGLIWLGTTSGLYTYDGKNTNQLGFKDVTKVSGSVNNELFAETLYGFKYWGNKDRQVKSFDMFDNVAVSTSDNKGNIFLVQGNGSIYFKAYNQDNFDIIRIDGLIANSIKAFFADAETLYIITDDGTLQLFGISADNGTIFLTAQKNIKVTSGISSVFYSENEIYVIDNEYKLYQLLIPVCQLSFIADLKLPLAGKGGINSAIVFRNEFYFGTETGLYTIRSNQAVKIPITKEVTCLLKDRYQDLIWIGTAGDGLYSYSYDPYMIKTNLLVDFCSSVSKPITAIYYDNTNTLWLGTKGNGIIQIPNYNPESEIKEVINITRKNNLTGDAVCSFAKSKHGIWMGCEEGLAYYSNKDKSISSIVLDNKISLKHIRDIYEQDSILWLACYGQGIAKVTLKFRNDYPDPEEMKLFSVNGDEASNRFSSIYVDNKGVWFTNKGKGIFKFEKDKLIPYPFEDKTFNSVNSIASDNEGGYIIATDFGIVKFKTDNELINKMEVLSNISAKGILTETQRNYWLSTDNGLLEYDSELNIFRSFDDSFGPAITEYIAGASFKDQPSGLLFFGGINGFITIKQNYYDEAMDYMPPLYTEKLTLFGKECPIADYLKKDSTTLILKSTENFFAVTFNALDYINGNNYVYYYKIGEKGHWIDNGNSGTVSFTDLAPGQYNLFIKYYNKVLNKESYAQNLMIQILPPWYRSLTAYLIYFLLLAGIVYLSVAFRSKLKRKNKEEELFKINQKRKEEIYEAKLDFFTDIAHEFCTPLTLIYGPCSRILEKENISPSIVKYASVISQNARRMNLLIDDLMDFKQIESGYKQAYIVPLNVSEIADRIMDSFKVNSLDSKIKIKKKYVSGITWNSDEKFLTTIITNLVSNAVKYSNNEGIVMIGISVDNQSLHIVVSNTGKGIRKEDIEDIFNRYAVFNNLEKQNNWRQNGLGLAITAGMVKLLYGSIDVASVPGETTTFTIDLPHVPADENEKAADFSVNQLNAVDIVLPNLRYEHKDDRPTITVIDDNAEMLWFICDLLNDEFNVVPINDPSQAINILNQAHTDLILCDIMMKELDGIALTRILKSDKSTNHIPLIIVSAVHEVEKQTEAMNAGAEMYVTKPFNSEYLKTTIRRLLGRKDDLREYFASPLSAYELNMGKMQHSEDKKFVKRIYAIINKNIQKDDLSPDFIASELGMSTRSLYRKLKDATDTGLLEMIHEGRLASAENLLMKSKLTIDEIVFKSGFTNRAGFYRVFTKKHGCTPTEFKERNSY